MKFNAYLVLGIVVVVALFGVLITLPVNTAQESEPIKSMAKQEATVALASEETESEPYTISVSTDKFNYESNEKVNFTITIDSPIETDKNEIKVYGVKNKYGAYKIKWSNDPKLAAGKTNISFTRNVPSCYGCSGIEPGVYPVFVGLYDEDENHIVNTSTEINITE